MTAQQDPEIVPFSKFFGALDPWLEQVVLLGGWAHRLYRLDSRARNLAYPPLATLDEKAGRLPRLLLKKPRSRFMVLRLCGVVGRAGSRKQRVRRKCLN
jgi:hypothetical protein